LFSLFKQNLFILFSLFKQNLFILLFKQNLFCFSNKIYFAFQTKFILQCDKKKIWLK